MNDYKTANMKKIILNNEKGFALLAALIACMILIAIGLLVMNMSTGDLLTSSATVGHKKAMAAMESGISKVMIDFGPDNWTAGNNYTTAANCGADTFSSSSYTWLTIVGGTDVKTKLAVCVPTQSAQPPMPAYGFSMGGQCSSGYGYMRYDTTIVGKNESYNSEAKADIGFGFGPVCLGE
jgi:hypothetical protein